MRPNHNPGDPRIFVFGSNLLGIHGAGAALYAAQKLGALPGQAWGLMGVSYQNPEGRCFALPTCELPGVPMTLKDIAHFVDTFLIYATTVPNLQFYVSAIGCGYAGYTEAEIAPLFKDAPENCDLPEGWRGA